MSTKSNNSTDSIQSQFLEILTPQSQEEIHEFEVAKLHFEFVSAFEQYMIENKVTKKALAAQVGTSAAYLTQIFSGNKTINLDLIVRIQKALELELVTKFCQKDERIVQWTFSHSQPRFNRDDFNAFEPSRYGAAEIEENATLIV
jgi:transcriptional regulator with XRE-family HTH domain